MAAKKSVKKSSTQLKKSAEQELFLSGKLSIGFFTLVRREIQRFSRLWSQTLIPPLITALLYMLIFGYSIGSRISSVQGFSYLQFIIPGLIMMSIITNSYANASTSLYIAKFQGNIQELLVSPLSYLELVCAFLLGGITRGLIVGLGVFIVSIVFSSVPLMHIFIILIFAILVSFIFACAGLLTGIWAKNFDQMSVFQTFIITPAIYLGGVFYSLHMLPSFWQHVSRFNPLFYMIDGFRYGFLGVSDGSVLLSFIILVVLAIVSFTLCVHLFRKGYQLRT